MYRFTFIMSNSHEVTVDAPSYEVAALTAQQQHPEEYVIGQRLVGLAPEADTEEEGSEDEQE